MSILDFAGESASNNSNTRRTSGAVTDRPKAKMWLNIGYERNGKFVNLPVGIPVDTMEPLLARGQNEDWVAFQSARNDLLKAIQGAGDELAPGGEIVLNLQVRLRHTADEMVVAKDDNAYSADLSGLVAAIVEPAAPKTDEQVA